MKKQKKSYAILITELLKMNDRLDQIYDDLDRFENDPRFGARIFWLLKGSIRKYKEQFAEEHYTG